MANFKKKSLRIISLILCIAMLMPAFCFASSADASGTVLNAEYRWYSGYAKNTYDDCFMDDLWFFEDSYTENPHLRTLSLALAMSSSSEALKYKKQTECAFRVMNQLGFTDLDCNEYQCVKPTVDSMGCCIGRKTIYNGDDASTLILILPRGANYDLEWVSNFTTGKYGFHEGFANARDIVLDFAKEYINSLKASGKLEDNIKVLICGHSRGGAIANLTAGYLVDHPNFFGKNDSNQNLLDLSGLFAYTFEAPPGAVASVMKKDKSVYDCIHNYKSEADPVPLLPNQQWGFILYGQTKTYQSFGNNDLSDLYLEDTYPGIRDAELLYMNYRDFSLKTIKNFIDENGISVSIENVPAYENMTQAEFINDRISRMYAAIDGGNAKLGRKNYVDLGYQELFRQICMLVKSGYIGETSIDALYDNLPDLVDAVMLLYIYYPYQSSPISGVQIMLATLAISKLLERGGNIAETIDARNQLKEMLADTGLSEYITNDNIDDIADSLVETCNNVLSILTSTSTTLLQKDRNLKALTAQKLSAILKAFVGSEAPQLLQPCAFLISEQGCDLAIDIINALIFDNDSDTLFEIFPVSTWIKDKAIRSIIKTDTEELKILTTAILNGGRLFSEHVPLMDMAWVKSDDSNYILPDLKEGSYESTQTVHLMSASKAAVYYTLNGSTPSEESKICGEDGIELKDKGYEKTYTIKAISVFERNGEKEISPVWTFTYTIGEGQPMFTSVAAAPIAPQAIAEEPDTIEVVTEEKSEEPRAAEVVTEEKSEEPQAAEEPCETAETETIEKSEAPAETATSIGLTIENNIKDALNIFLNLFLLK